jgi:chitodextrinase
LRRFNYFAGNITAILSGSPLTFWKFRREIIGVIGVAQLMILLMALAPTLQASTIPSSSGWFDIPNTHVRSVCPPNNFGGSGYAFHDQCNGLIGAWNGGVFDTIRNRFIFWGGGHHDYLGNEIYSLDMNTLVLSRLTDPAVPVATDCPESLAGGTQPNSRHTYGGIQYLPNVDKMFVFGGALATCGNASQATWLFNFSTNQWERKNPSGPLPSGGYGIVTAYDPNTGKVFLHDSSNLFTYSPTTNAYARLTSNGAGLNLYTTATIDPKRKKLVILGGGQAWIYNISGSTFTPNALSTTGGSAIINSASPGLAYSPVRDRIVAWSGGNTVYELNLDTNTWTAASFSGGPAAGGVGVFGHWQYSPALDVFVTVNNADQDICSLRIPSSGGGNNNDANNNDSNKTPPSVPAGLTATAVTSSQINLSWNASTSSVSVAGYKVFRGGSQIATVTTGTYYLDSGLAAATTYSYTVAAYDTAGKTSAQSAAISATTQAAPPPLPSGGSDFATRCAAPGVIKCVGFDQAADIASSDGRSNSGLYPGDHPSYPPILDTTVKASGKSSLRFTTPSQSSTNVGSYWTNFSPDLSVQFGENSQFFVQWRQRFSSEFLTTLYKSDGWKQAIIGTGDQPGGIVYYSCTDLEVTTQNSYSHGFPTMYNSCSGSTSHSAYDPFIEPFGAYDFKLENAMSSPYCLYSQNWSLGVATTQGPGHCAKYFPNEWMTFQIGIKTGPRVKDEFVNSYVYLWVAREGQPSRLVMSWGPYNLTAGSLAENQRFGKVWLLPYQSKKDPSQVTPIAYTWYDELIISRNRIADPTITTTPVPVISNVAASNITTSGATIKWSTDEAADSQLEYGATASYDHQTKLDTTLVISHSQTISGLSLIFLLPRVIPAASRR